MPAGRLREIGRKLPGGLCEASNEELLLHGTLPGLALDILATGE